MFEIKFNAIKLCAVILAVMLCAVGCAEPYHGEPIGGLMSSETSGESETAETAGTQEPETDEESTEKLQTETEAVTMPETVEPDETAGPEETTPPPPGHVGVTGISLSVYEVSIAAGESQMPWVTMYPANASDKGEIWISSDTSVATVDKYGNITGIAPGKCTVTVTSTDNPNVSAEVSVTIGAGITPTYIDGILIVNKTYALPKSYAPGWDTEASNQIWVMFAAAQAEGLSMRVQSGYRSYVDQSIIYDGYVARDGQAAADRYSARPGHSEHQSGLAFDLNTYYYEGLTTEFGNTPEGKWLAANCHKYGFIIRYPQDKEHITGYMYEPWHVRYLGVEKATLVYESGLCLEEYLNITSSYS